MSNLSNSNNKPSAEKLAELLQRARLARSLAIATIPANKEETLSTDINSNSNSNTNTNTVANVNVNQGTGRNGELITYNTKQLEFIQVAGTGISAILIGAAGTGKTTCMQGAITRLITTNIAGILDPEDHKYLPASTPGIVCCSFTRRAVANLRRAMPEDMKNNCLTIHSLLEYEPVYYTVTDTNTGLDVKTMRFEPTRNQYRPLPSSIKCVVIDEASMVSVELFTELTSALPSDVQFIFLGDIQQLPPVFGAAILGFKMLELKTVELTEVYRQALESPIIRLAHRILSGIAIPKSEYPEWHTAGKLTIHPWKKKLHADIAVITIAKFLTVAIDAGAYIPEDDMVLIPFNKACGTIELNKHIAQHMARKRNSVVWEVIAGFNKHYLAVGDKVLVEKEDAVITKIEHNTGYSGAKAIKESTTLDYWGYDAGPESTNNPNTEHHITDDNTTDDSVDFLLAQAVSLGGSSDEERVRQSSHSITVELLESNKIVTLNTASTINSLLLSYALTVHKSQGSEWRKVFLMLHQSHATMLQRELLYTAVTRAREELYVICEPESFTNGILSQRIKGNTLAEKAEYFKGKLIP